MSAAAVAERSAKTARTQAAAEQIEQMAVSAAHAGAETRAICPVERIGMAVAALSDAYNSSQTGKDVDTSSKLFADNTRSYLYDRERDLADASAHLLAQSPLGAIFQLSTISAGLDTIVDLVEPDQETKFRFHNEHRRATAALYSVLRFLERTHGVSRFTIGGDRYMPDFLDPHTRVERALMGLHGADPARMNDKPYPPTEVFASGVKTAVTTSLPEPDAALIALGREFDAAWEKLRVAEQASHAAETERTIIWQAHADELSEASRTGGPEAWGKVAARLSDHCEPPIAACSAASAALCDIGDRIMAKQPATLDGIRVQAAVVREAYGHMLSTPREDLDWEVFRLFTFFDRLEALQGGAPSCGGQI